MTRRKSPPGKLHSGHFAFMRALAQGLDERASWSRYLSLEGEHANLRQVRRTVAWIRDEFAAAARRKHRPGTARLILLDPDRFASAPAIPSLSEFAQMQGMEDFSEAEQLEAYEESYPNAGRGGQGGPATSSRRGRVIERQLEALRWLQSLAAQDPKPADRVAAWVNPSMAARLELAGVPTLVALVERINTRGARWWVDVPGVGERKALRILDWLHAIEEVLGLRVGVHAQTPRAQLLAADLAAFVPAATAIRCRCADLAVGVAGRNAVGMSGAQRRFHDAAKWPRPCMWEPDAAAEAGQSAPTRTAVRVRLQAR